MSLLKKSMRALALLAAVLVLAGLATATLRTGPAPEIEVLTDARAIGPKTPVVVKARAGGRGLAGLRVEV